MSHNSNVIHVHFPASTGRRMRLESDTLRDHEDDLATSLAGIFTDTYELLCETYACHWQVEKREFPALVDLTENAYLALLQKADELAECMRALDVDVPLKVPYLEDVGFAANGDLTTRVPEVCNILIARHIRLQHDLNALALRAHRSGDLAIRNLAMLHARDHLGMAKRLRSLTLNQMPTK